jgi:hypothetical protein
MDLLTGVKRELESIAAFRRGSGELNDQLARLEFLYEDFLRLDQKEQEAEQQIQHLQQLRDRFVFSRPLQQLISSGAALRVDRQFLACLGELQDKHRELELSDLPRESELYRSLEEAYRQGARALEARVMAGL